MFSRIRGLFGLSKSNVQDSSELVLVEDDKIPELPFVLSSLFYLAVVLFVGLPVWFYTCSSTIYSLPTLTELDEKLTNPTNSQPKLHLDISVIQLSGFSEKVDVDLSDERSIYLRDHLPKNLGTTATNITYDVDWRVRRPTVDEMELFKTYQMSQHDAVSVNKSALGIFERELTKIHRPSNRFRLFMYVIEDQYHRAYCDLSRKHDYTISFDRFVYLCPLNAPPTEHGHKIITDIISEAVENIYSPTVDERKVKHILGTQIDLVFSLLPEVADLSSTSSLSALSDKIHRTYMKNVIDEFPELKEIVNIRLIVQNVFEVLSDSLVRKIIKSEVQNDNSSSSVAPARSLQVDRVHELFHQFDSRVNKHSPQSVHNVIVIVPDPENQDITFDASSGKEASKNMHILEGQETSSMTIISDDRSMVLSLRAIVRRVVGLSSANMCERCTVRRDVFFNRWELDALVGVLTLKKLMSTLLSLRSVSRQVVGIKITSNVSKMATEARDLALKSIECLESRQTSKAYQLATKAYEISELAFYDPSLLESLYFPDDMKYAIYLPLFLPLAFPFALSLIRPLRFLLRGRTKEKLKMN